MNAALFIIGMTAFFSGLTAILMNMVMAQRERQRRSMQIIEKAICYGNSS